jgi:elongation factor G
MTVEIVAPIEFQGSVIGALNQRKGTIVDTEMRDEEFTVVAEVALNDMFGYSGQLRSLTQGKGECLLVGLCLGDRLADGVDLRGIYDGV